MKALLILTVALVLGLICVACGGGSAAPLTASVDRYVALAPRVLRAGERETVSLTLFHGQRLAASGVTVSLTKDGSEVAVGSTRVSGKGSVDVQVPAEARGEYTLNVSGQGFRDEAKVQVQEGTLLFVETDKPIYKPGQTIMMRVVALNSELKPVASDVTVEIADAKGNKIFKQVARTDEYGMASLQLPLSTEPNLGVWKINAKSGDTSTDLDVRVEEYVLPKYEINVTMAKPWFLVNEAITGSVDVQYSFGKPVNGELQVKATRYVGQWQQFATTTAEVVDGKAQFEVSPVEYAAGVPEAGGNGNVQLDFTVKERNTDYEEKTTELITVSASPLTIQLVPETPSFKPGLPYNVLVVTQTPDGQPVDSTVNVSAYFTDDSYNGGNPDTLTVKTEHGVGTATLAPPASAGMLSLQAQVGDAYAYRQISAAYSPSGNFINVSQTSGSPLKVGDRAEFHVNSTSEANTFYFEVVSRDRVVFTSVTKSNDISFEVTPAMSGAGKLLVYQILPNSEVAADYIPFEVEAVYPHNVTASFSTDEAKPGDKLQVDLQTEGKAKVGVAAVDRSVFILAENRLNLQEVFAQIEQLYQEPQAELHDGFIPGPQVIPGATDTIADAGLLVMTNQNAPDGKKLEYPMFFGGGEDMAVAGVGGPAAMAFAGNAPLPESGGVTSQSSGLAEVQRVRQFFPETWIWHDEVTGDDGKASISVDAPDTITTWELRAVAVSPDKGLGVAEAELKVFQPFFLSADLPYSAIRGEEFPLRVSLYNYTDHEHEFQVEIGDESWFDRLDEGTKTVRIAANDTGSTQFTIRPKGIGTQTVKVTARSGDSADAVIKSIIIEPEGVQKEQLASGVLSGGASKTIDMPLPAGIVPDSARTSIAITGSLLSQTIEGLDQLLGMPYGCGEQNMLLFAPDAYILKYLEGTNQLKPEIRAKAETLLVTGYQRELTYRRADGSFSAFGDSDDEGSLFLTAFVLKTFAQAKGLIYIDEAVLQQAISWLVSHQNLDGSFQQVGFVHHQELLGGVSGQTALTAYVAIAMLEAGQNTSGDRAITYLEQQLDGTDDPYALALLTYALELADSPSADKAYQKLLAAGVGDDEGLHWPGERNGEPRPAEGDLVPFPGQVSGSSDIEATGYATLALTEHGDTFNAGKAAKWLTAHRNSFGGFGSTQDTVVALQALTKFAASAGEDTEMAVTVTAGGESHELQITPANFDVLQTLDLPAGAPVTVSAEGKGQAVYQAVTRYNTTKPEPTAQSAFDIKVEFDSTNVSVNDIVGVNASLTFNPPQPMDAGMIVLDVAVPTGFAPVADSLQQLVSESAKVKRYDIAGRKVILYLEDVSAGETVNVSFDVIAQYPVRGKGAASQAYSYYRPEWRGESIGEAVIIH